MLGPGCRAEALEAKASREWGFRLILSRFSFGTGGTPLAMQLGANRITPPPPEQIS